MIHNDYHLSKDKINKDIFGDVAVDPTGDEDPIDEDEDTRVGDLEVSVSLGAEFKIIELGFELIDQERVEMGRIPLVRLEMRSRSFKDWTIYLISALGTS
ncbi:hypothetical protein Tco_1071219 [Tanacetum coccineum]